MYMTKNLTSLMECFNTFRCAKSTTEISLLFGHPRCFVQDIYLREKFLITLFCNKLVVFLIDFYSFYSFHCSEVSFFLTNYSTICLFLCEEFVVELKWCISHIFKQFKSRQFEISIRYIQCLFLGILTCFNRTA